ncbi:Hypothetical predicted protein [Lecanosticta acicola]|uniref:DUF7587 domain-containing protein n=1 Tax=Lecanosticta acicola TaxID=111012 RepID=A0AAI9EFZ5_9PEZI|nr:Hypothetical predicted protein [Lecanosticta acicola]
MPRPLIEKYRYPQEDLPRYLWRVQYTGTNTISNDSGLWAAETTSSSFSWHAFRRRVINHFTWKNRYPSPFISFFSEEDHAKNWAEKMRQAGREDVEILCVDTQEDCMEGIYVFKLSEMVRNLRIWRSSLAKPARQHLKNGFFCLHHVPREAICEESVVL